MAQMGVSQDVAAYHQLLAKAEGIEDLLRTVAPRISDAAQAEIRSEAYILRGKAQTIRRDIYRRMYSHYGCDEVKGYALEDAAKAGDPCGCGKCQGVRDALSDIFGPR